MALDDVEFVGLPDFDAGPGQFKFVQLSAGESHYMLFGPVDSTSHRIILKGFLDERGIPYELVDLDTGDKGPALSNQGHYFATGMGQVVFSASRKRCSRPMGRSMDYDLEPDPEFNDAFARVLPEGWVMK